MYRYPDYDDQIALLYQSLYEPYPGYCTLSEQHAFDVAESYVRRKQLACLLDIGCGKGRLLPRFASTYRSVVGVEPDNARADFAKYLVCSRGLRNVKIIEGDFSQVELNGATFDVVVCSHVLQHVIVQSAGAILRRIHSALRPHGVAIIALPRSRKNSDRWITSRIARGQVVASSSCEEEFNQLITNDGEILPIRLFSERTVTQMLADRFQILRIWKCSYMARAGPLDRWLLRDRLLNLPFIRNDVADNMVIVARARDAGRHPL